MTTINGVTFNMKNLRVVAVHRNSVSEQPGSDTNFITDMGYDGLVLRLEGYENTLATYDSVISEFMKSGEQTLVYRTGWQFTVYSVQLTPELIEGIVDNYFPYDLILYTSTPYRESTTLDCRATEITANNQEWSAEDIPCTIIDNWDFEDWNAGTSVAPDSWIDYSLTSISRSTTHKTGSYSAQLTPSAGADNLYQLISLDYAGKELTFGCWVYSAYQDHARIALTDDTGTTYSSFHSGGSTWGWLTVTRTIDSGTAYIRAGLYPSITFVEAYFDGAVLVEGDSIQDNTFIRDIDTDGSVDAVPDIKVTSDMTPLGTISEYNSPGGTPEGLAWDGTNMWSSDFGDSEIYKHNSDMTIHTTYNSPGNGVRSLAWDGTRMWSIDSADNKIYKHNLDMTVNASYNTPSTAPHALAWDGSRIWSSDIGLNKIYKHNVDLTVDTTYDSPDTSPTGLIWDGTNIWSSDPNSDKIYKHNSDMTVYSEYDTTGSVSGLGWDGTNIWMSETTNNKIFKLCGEDCTLSDIEVYNVADSSVKCNVASNMLAGAVYRINSDGTGTINYTDDFTTQKWYGNVTELNVTHDEVDNELDIADDGYVYWPIDTKGSVTGTPTLTAQINITTGTPTIQISTNGSTWYDITTVIVDDVDTVYELDSSSLHLKGQTLFYWRIDCVKAGAATCSIKSFELDINIVTIDFEHPVITAGGAVSTFRCDQDADSGMNCTVALYYRGRSWPA